MVVINYRAPGAVSSGLHYLEGTKLPFSGPETLIPPEVDIWRYSQYGLSLHNEPLVVTTPRPATALVHVMCSNLSSVVGLSMFYTSQPYLSRF